MFSILGGLGWIITRSNWIIYQSQQIKIEGNQFLSEDAIRTLLPISYPKSLLQLEPEELSYQLEATADYAGVLYPDKMSITYEKDNENYHEVEGYMGQRNARSVIKARLDYGGLKVD